MIALTRSLLSAHRPAGSPPVRRPGFSLLLGVACALFGCFGNPGTARAADRARSQARSGGAVLPVAADPATPEAVDFPAAASIQPGAGVVGPVRAPGDPARVDPQPNALSQYARPDDLVVFEPGLNSTTPSITVINGGLSGTFGAATVVASPTVGTSANNAIPFHTGVYQGCISPTQQLYYWDNTLLAFVAIDLTQPNYPRTLVPVPSDKSLVPGSNGFTYGPELVWDYSTGTILYVDTGASSAKSTIARGVYRLNPVTGANTLYAPYTAGTIDSIAIRQDGSAVYVLDSVGSGGPNSTVSLLAPGSGALTVVDGGTTAYGSAASQPRYYGVNSISWDIFNQRINLYDVGTDQTNARILRIDPNARTRTFITNGGAGPSATYGGSIISGPGSGFTNTAGRNLYMEATADFNNSFPATIAPGASTSTRVGSSQFTLGALAAASFIPPTLPVIGSPTATPGSNGTSAVLGASVTSAGTAFTPPAILGRGVVYAAASTNANPTIGGTGVTQLTSTASTGAFTVGATGLSPGTTYAYAGYVSTYVGTVYTTAGTFTTATTPSVTTDAATNLTGTSATLNGNVTADGGSGLTVRGFVYSSSNTAPVIGGGNVVNVVDSGTATGTYSDPINGLTNGTTYYFRAYATNGVGTTYGSVLSLRTYSPPTANSQTVFVQFNTATSVILSGSDPNSPAQTLTYTVTSSPTKGSLSGTAPNLTYTPNNGRNGTDSFQFTTTNSSGLTSNTATVTLNIAVGTPTANSQSVSVQFNTATAVTLTGSDPDVPALTLTYTVVNAPAHGTLSGTAPNLTYTPTANYQGADVFTFRVSNGTNTSNTATVSITVAAGTPTANSQSLNVNYNQAAAITLTGSDPDSPALPLTYTVTTAPAHGTLSGTAPNLTYTPVTGYSGSDSFNFTVSNGQKTSSQATVSITVIGQPTIGSFSPASGAPGTTVVITGTNLQGTSGFRFFRNVPATSFTVNSATQITVTVPAGATTGPMTLVTGSATLNTPTKFVVTAVPAF